MILTDSVSKNANEEGPEDSSEPSRSALDQSSLEPEILVENSREPGSDSRSDRSTEGSETAPTIGAESENGSASASEAASTIEVKPATDSASASETPSVTDVSPETDIESASESSSAIDIEPDTAVASGSESSSATDIEPDTAVASGSESSSATDIEPDPAVASGSESSSTIDVQPESAVTSASESSSTTDFDCVTKAGPGSDSLATSEAEPTTPISLFLPEETDFAPRNIFEDDDQADGKSFIIKLSALSGSELPPQVDLAKYAVSTGVDTISPGEGEEVSSSADTALVQVRPFSPKAVDLDGGHGTLSLPYRTRGARLVLLGILAFTPVWAIWLPFAMSYFALQMINGLADSRQYLMFFVLAAALASVILQIVMCLDKRLRINSQGVTFPLSFLCITGPQRTRRWSSLKTLVYRPSEDREHESSLTLQFADTSVPLTVGGFAKEDLRKLIFAAQTHCNATDPNAKNALLPSFTELWEEELSSRFSPTVFVPLQPGTRLCGDRIEVLGQTACGGLSAIYMGRMDGERRVIVKEFVTPVSANEQIAAKALELFAREAEVLKSLNHPSIAKVIDHFSQESRHYLVLEHISGVDLRRFIRDNGRQHEEIVLRWAIDVVDVLDHLHTRTPPIIHRDLTPDNLIFTANGGIAVIDFGAASAFVSEATGTLIGKQNYMAPEQFRGRATPQSDIYALGCVMHFLLTGKDPEPLSTSHPKQINEGVSDATERLVAACTALELKDRIDSVHALTGRLRGVLNARRSSVKAGM